MFKNYFTIAYRNLTRNKAFTYINITGLAVGLATCLLIMLYIFDENSYDKHHKDGDRIYRIASATGAEKRNTWAAAPGPVAWAMKNDLPEVEQVTRLLTFSDIEKMELSYTNNSVNKQFIESNGYYVDSTFFQLVTYDFVYGNPLIALNNPNTIVISENISNKFFGNDNPLGKSIKVNTPLGKFDYTVQGVFNNKKNKSHIPSNFFLSMRNQDMGLWAEKQTRWSTNNIFFTYTKLKPGISAAIFEPKLKLFFQRRAGDEIKAAGFQKTLFLQPLRDIYLHSSIGNEIAANGNITYLYILGSIGAFILLIACINFMNLSTARSEKRAKEVGVRKVMGAARSSLILQLLGESLIMCCIALAVSLVLAWTLLPVFNMLTQKDLHPMDHPGLIVSTILVALLTGFLSGIYPAFYLSAFKPVSTMKGKITNSFSATAIRKGLVIFQFTISICLVLATIVIWKQLDFLKNSNLGFDKTQRVILPLQLGYKNSQNDYTVLRNELLKIPQIKMVSSGSTYPGIPNINDLLFFAEGKNTSDVVDVQLASIENDYLETLGMKLVTGRTFSKEFKGDSSGIILNEAAIQQLGYQLENAVGKKIYFDLGQFKGSLNIVGVVKDFNFESLHNTIRPLGFTSAAFANKYCYTIASLTTSNYAGALTGMEKVWKKIYPNSPFVYSFLDQDFQRNYEKDRLTSQIIICFTIIAILIACLGLLGLAAFSAEQRTKEIGIRKVLGASVTSVTALLSKDFLKLVIIAIVIASPLAWTVMNKWLENFAYRIDISWWMFAAAGVVAIFIALITVSFQSIKAALSNPIKCLRTE